MYDVQLTECGRDLLARIKAGSKMGDKTGLVVEGEKVGEVDPRELVQKQEVLVS